MHVFHTAGVPPSSGSTIFAIIGWTRNSSDELRKSVTTSRMIMECEVEWWGKRDAGRNSATLAERWHPGFSSDRKVTKAEWASDQPRNHGKHESQWGFFRFFGFRG